MIAHGHGVVADGAHHLQLHFAPEEVVVGRALEAVAGVEQQAGRASAAGAVHQRGQPGEAAHRVAIDGAKRQEMGVHVIGVQDPDPLRGRVGGHQEGQEQQRDEGSAVGRQMSPYQTVKPLHRCSAREFTEMSPGNS
jgi:hypothetical protein